MASQKKKGVRLVREATEQTVILILWQEQSFPHAAIRLKLQSRSAGVKEVVLEAKGHPHSNRDLANKPTRCGVMRSKVGKYGDRLASPCIRVASLCGVESDDSSLLCVTSPIFEYGAAV